MASVNPEPWRLGWFKPWCADHTCVRHPSDHWPSPHSEQGKGFFAEWHDSFERNGVTEAEATSASKLLMEQPAVWPTEHLRALLDIIKHTRAVERQRAREAEEREPVSRDCPDCGGSGWAPRYFVVEKSFGPTRFRGALYCRCQRGRENHDKHMASRPEAWAGADDLLRHPHTLPVGVQYRYWANGGTVPRAQPPRHAGEWLAFDDVGKHPEPQA